MKIRKSHLRRIIKESLAIPSWVQGHFAWRNPVFTRSGELRYINDIADPGTVDASEEMGTPVTPGANVYVIMGANPGSKGVWMHDSELLDLIDREGWHERSPPEGASPEGFWDGRGEWLEPGHDDFDLPPDLDLPPATEGKMRIRKSTLKRIIKEEKARLKESDYQRVYLDDKIKQDMFAYLLDVGVYPEELQRYERVDGNLVKLDEPRSHTPPRINPMPHRGIMVKTPWGTSGYTSTARKALEAGAEENGWTEDQVWQMHRHLNNMID